MSQPAVAPLDAGPSVTAPKRLPLDPRRKPRCLHKGKFNLSCIGHVYWTFCSIYEPILAGLGEFKDAPMSENMLDDGTWLSDTARSGDPECCLPCRPAIVHRVFNSQEADVLCLATFGGVPIQEADPHLQHYAVSLMGTPPWPRDASPVVTLNRPWPVVPCYAMMQQFTIAPHRVKAKYRQDNYVLETEHLINLQRIMSDKVFELQLVPNEELARRHAQLPRISRLPNQRRAQSLASLASGYPSLHQVLVPVPEVSENQPVALSEQPSPDVESAKAHPAAPAVAILQNPDDPLAESKSPDEKSSNSARRKDWMKRKLYRFGRL